MVDTRDNLCWLKIICENALGTNLSRFRKEEYEGIKLVGEKELRGFSDWPTLDCRKRLRELHAYCDNHGKNLVLQRYPLTLQETKNEIVSIELAREIFNYHGINRVVTYCNLDLDENGRHVGQLRAFFGCNISSLSSTLFNRQNGKFEEYDLNKGYCSSLYHCRDMIFLIRSIKEGKVLFA